MIRPGDPLNHYAAGENIACTKPSVAVCFAKQTPTATEGLVQKIKHRQLQKAEKQAASKGLVQARENRNMQTSFGSAA